MKKKMMILILSACLSVMTFVGCALSSSSNSTASNTTTNSAQKDTPPGGGIGSNGPTITGTAAYSVSGETASKSGETYTATSANQSGVMANKSGNLTLSNATINKTGGDTTSEDESNFYGLNAGLVAKAGSKVIISGSKINTSAEGSNGIFATGDGSVINVSDTTINTTKNSSRGLDATMNGTVNATNVTINTAGTHCASIATDRGNGTINVKGGSMATTGKDSPGIYSTGKITVADATIKATGSEAAVVEGKNSITLNNVNISGEKTNGVMLYQSFSGDAETGTASFTMTGGSLSSKAGALFFITNTDAVANIKNVAVTNTTDTLISAGATERWGTSGKNGGKFNFTADTETLSGKVICDKISSVSMTLKNNTTFTGSINTDNKLAKVTINLDATSKWVVNSDSYVQALADSDSSLANIQSNGHTIYYDATNSANSWIGGKTITLSDGGNLTPLK
ncbi:hypothetical protein JMF89_02430 [Clostridiaceae bacterium UIB06]|uniref:Lipoprotein n=1 Tax=Clostridium thailandense TaxID=2794346 RepID=A0A949TZ44_9CLOT|nr:hypothetical protein [Clostridium thailandense]MCH5136066.1 hypothetical protein [Clostridiaceae bacterium UIB06]